VVSNHDQRVGSSKLLGSDKHFADAELDPRTPEISSEEDN